jgi:hypothetical protein
MGWHADDEKELGKNPAIASVSFGATRSFQLKHNNKIELKKFDIPLTNGSLLLMKGTTQHFWKHQIPQNYIKNNKENKLVIKIFIIRNLETWLVSMFHNPYHLHKMKYFNCFLEKKQKINNKDDKYVNDIIINKDDQNKTIFDIRYYKLKKIKQYCQENENIILVNLDYLQNDENCIHFLKEINNKYNLNKTNFSLIEKHTKNSKDIKNKVYETKYEDFQETIDLYKNKEIENEINNLTFFIKISDESVKKIYSNFILSS